MNEGRTVFSQLMDWLPKHEFNKSVERYHGNHHVRTLTCYEQFLVMAFAQLTYRESLRDIETCLGAFTPRLYHTGIRAPIARSTLADANEKRSWKIFSDFAYVLIREATALYAAEDFAADLNTAAYALDSTTIDLCLSLFPWAQFRKHKAAVKMHTLLNLHGNIPALVIITSGRVHDVNILDQLVFEAGSFYVVDRGYLDFARLHGLHQAGSFFVTRTKKNFRFHRRASRSVNKRRGLRFDQTIVVDGFYTHQNYPDTLRRIGYTDPVSGQAFIFLTNNFILRPLNIALLYKSRWQIELFFKWVKQHLRIKAFYGTTENAVKTQIWIALSVYVLVAILKKRLGLQQSLYTILQILSITLFEKMPILEAFAQHPSRLEKANIQNQLYLQGFLTGQ